MTNFFYWYMKFWRRICIKIENVSL